MKALTYAGELTFYERFAWAKTIARKWSDADTGELFEGVKLRSFHWYLADDQFEILKEILRKFFGLETRSSRLPSCWYVGKDVAFLRFRDQPDRFQVHMFVPENLSTDQNQLLVYYCLSADKI